MINLIKKLKQMFTMEKHQGTVKFFNKSKGYGFIKSSDGVEYFVHATGLVHEIKENDSVEFEVKDGKKGLNAVNVEVV